MIVSCVHPVAVLNAAFCITSSLLMLVEDAYGVYVAFCDVVFVCVENVCEDGVCSVYVWWWLNVSESSLGVCSELCPVCFPIVRECVSVLL